MILTLKNTSKEKHIKVVNMTFLPHPRNGRNINYPPGGPIISGGKIDTILFPSRANPPLPPGHK